MSGVRKPNRVVPQKNRSATQKRKNVPKTNENVKKRLPNPRDPLSALGFQEKKRKNDEFYERGKFIFQPIPSLISILQIPLKLQNRPPAPAKNTKHRFGFKLKPRQCLL